MSRRSHQPIGGRRSSVVEPGPVDDVDRLSPSTSAPSRICFGHPHDLHHLGDGVHADDVRAAEHRGGHRGGRPPVALDAAGARRAPRAGTTCATARRAAAGRARGELGEPRQHTIAVRRPFGEPDAGIDDRRVSAARRPPSRGACARRSSPPPRRRRRRSAPRAYMSLERPRVCIRTSAAPRRGDDAGQRRIVPQAADVVDDRRARGRAPRARPSAL